MKKLHLLSTVAASLLLAAGTAAAQTKEPAPERAPAAQQHAPAEKIAPSMHAGEHKKATTTGQASKEPGKAEMNAEHKEKSGASVKKNAESKPAASQKSSQSVTGKSATTGQGAAAGAAKPSTEQRTKITTIIKKQKVKPAHLTISVHVGATVPASVHFYPLPVEVVDVYPEWRGYDFILVGDEIIIVNPRTHRIVAILTA
jgi:Protein of unknown function (DUF1236)